MENFQFKQIKYELANNIKEDVKLLLDVNELKDFTKRNVYSPLMFALQHTPTLEYVKFLVEEIKLDVTELDDYEETLIDFAIKQNDLSVAEYLLEKGAKFTESAYDKDDEDEDMHHRKKINKLLKKYKKTNYVEKQSQQMPSKEVLELASKVDFQIREWVTETKIQKNTNSIEFMQICRKTNVLQPLDIRHIVAA